MVTHIFLGSLCSHQLSMTSAAPCYSPLPAASGLKAVSFLLPFFEQDFSVPAGGPVPMQQTPASKSLSTDQSPAPLMPAQLPLHSLHDPQASLVSAPQQVGWQGPRVLLGAKVQRPCWSTRSTSADLLLDPESCTIVAAS